MKCLRRESFRNCVCIQETADAYPDAMETVKYHLGLGTPRFAALRINASPAGTPHCFIRKTLLRWGSPEQAPEIHLVAYELASNASRHALIVGQHAWLSLAMVHGQITCAVQDPSPAPPRPRKPTSNSEHGRGLEIVQALSDAYGYTLSHSGKSVWARFII